MSYMWCGTLGRDAVGCNASHVALATHEMLGVPVQVQVQAQEHRASGFIGIRLTGSERMASRLDAAMHARRQHMCTDKVATLHVVRSYISALAYMRVRFHGAAWEGPSRKAPFIVFTYRKLSSTALLACLQAVPSPTYHLVLRTSWFCAAPFSPKPALSSCAPAPARPTP